MENSELNDLVATARDAGFDREVVLELHRQAEAAGRGSDFAIGLVEASDGAVDGIQIGELRAGEEQSPGGAAFSAPDRITTWLKGVPFVGQRLARTRDAMAFMRKEADDPQAVRVVKFVGRGFVIAATGATGYVLVAEG